MAPHKESLCDDLISNILSWLPVKSLIRFRCVCKSWNSLISNPCFINLHFQRSATNPKLIVLPFHQFNDDGMDRWNVVSYPIHSSLCDPSSNVVEEDHGYPWKRPCRWLLSCNGLIFLVNYSIHVEFTEYRVYLWNPATGLGAKKASLDINHHIAIQCSLPRFAFGCDHLSGTYKVVAVFVNHSTKEFSQQTFVKVYNMSDNCWRKIQSFPFIPTNDGEHVGGTLNWLTVRNNNYYDYSWVKDVTNDKFVILSLDLSNETYGKMLMPCVADEVPHECPILGVLRDCLCVSHDYKKTHFVVWQMKELGDQKSWTQLVNVSLQNIQGCLELLPLCMSENGNILMVSSEWRAVLYSRKDNRLEHTEICSNIKWKHARFKVHVESLVDVLPR